MSNAAFQSTSSTEEPFYCPRFSIRQQSRELEALKRKVELLPKGLSFLKSEVSSLNMLPTDVPLFSISSGNASTRSKNDAETSVKYTTVTPVFMSLTAIIVSTDFKNPFVEPPILHYECHFNVVIRVMEECPKERLYW